MNLRIRLPKCLHVPGYHSPVTQQQAREIENKGNTKTFWLQFTKSKSLKLWGSNGVIFIELYATMESVENIHAFT